MKWQTSSSTASSGSITIAENGVGSGSSSGSTTSYTIQGVESGTLYSITVRVSNAAGTTDSPLVYVATSKEGNKFCVRVMVCTVILLLLAYVVKNIWSSGGSSGSLFIVMCLDLHM